MPLFLFKIDLLNQYKILGISYITFKNIQCLSDAENFKRLSFKEYFSFMLFPLSLLAGPIDKSNRFSSDLNNGYENLNRDSLIEGWELFIIGCLFKFVFSNIIDQYWMSHLDIKSQNLWILIQIAYSYSFFLYFDFAGYSAIAIGLSKMIGINLPKNFDAPYLSKNPQEFWRRFHISLGSWLTSYFFLPIYKFFVSNETKTKFSRLTSQNISIMLTFLLMGIWNGLRWYYIFSGFLFGLYSVIHNLYIHYLKIGGFDFFNYLPNQLRIPVKRLLMFHAAVFSLYFFSGKF